MELNSRRLSIPPLVLFGKTLFFLLGILISNPAYAKTAATEPLALPKGIEERCDRIVKEIPTRRAEDLYAEFDEEVKKTIPLDQAKSFISEIKKILAGSQHIRFSRANYYAQDNVYTLVYDVEADKKIFEFTLGLKQRGEKYFIRAFHLADKPRPLWNLKEAPPRHYLVAGLFFLVILLQFVSFFYFLFRKHLKRKILYILASLLGFPVGLAMNWTSGLFALKVGFNIPAVGLSAPADYPSVWTVIVFFPLGLYFMLRDLNRRPF